MCRSTVAFWRITIHFILRFSPDLILPLVGISGSLAKVTKLYSRMRSSVINANVSISRPMAGCTQRDANMLYEEVYENVRRRRHEERRKRQEEVKIPRGCSRVSVSFPRCTGDAPSRTPACTCACICVCVYVCLCRRQILPHNFGIFHCAQSEPQT